MRKMIDNFKTFLIKENISNVKVPRYLYHATFEPLLETIKSEGLGGVSAKQLWDDSKVGVVYLALDAHTAYSYAETAFDNEDVPEEWEEKIIVLAIDTNKLDEKKFFLDSNVLDNEGDTVEYHGVIPFSAIEVMDDDDF